MNPGSTNGTVAPASPETSPPTYTALVNAAGELLRHAAEIGRSGPSEPVAQEWQGAFAAARLAIGARPEQAAAIAAFGLNYLARGDVLKLPAPAAAVARTLAAATVELRAAGQSGAAAALSSLTLEMAGEPQPTAVLPFFVCQAALIRARLAHDVDGHSALTPSAYWQIARREAEAAAGPGLVLCGGLSGSGKSFVGTGVAATLGAAIVSSDRVRKHLAGIEPRARTPAERSQQVYSTRMTDRVYRRLAQAAAEQLREGLPVVLDATYLTPARRELPLLIAREVGASAAIVWCELSQAEAAARLRRRAGHGWAVSEADARIRDLQRKGARPPRGDECDARLLRVDAGAEPAVLFDRLMPRLRRVLRSVQP
ncbi:MAG TPA: AAA family ATPase [Dehalococcoidia bacterium]|nr:AAA family ATPase [Dehalococcoidia bacterium]